MWQWMSGDGRWGPLENLGDRTSSQGPPTRTCAVNAAAERHRAPVLSRYRRRGEASAAAANPEKEKAKFPFYSTDYQTGTQAAKLWLNTTECARERERARRKKD